MSLTIFAVTREDDIDPSVGEESELIQFGSLPQLFDLIKMGSDRLWKVVYIEPYHRANEVLHLAVVSRVDLAVADRRDWTANWMRRRSPNLSFNVQLSPNYSVLQYGYSMEGKAPTGQLKSYSPIGEGTLMKAELEPWVIDRTDAYSNEAGIYTSVHLCWCSPVKEVAIAA